MKKNKIEIEQSLKALVSDVQKMQHDPLLFCRYVFPWGEGDLTYHEGLRFWQNDILTAIGEHLQNPSTRYQPLKISVASGHGIGKSGLIAMLCHWALATSIDTKIVVTANTQKQLQTKTWPELHKWTKLSLLRDCFVMKAESVHSADPLRAKSWRADAVPWSEHNTEAFAGLHNQGKRIVLVFDEASNIADKVWEVAEGALTDEDTEIIWLAFGNPTRNTGRFRECFRRYRSQWVTRQIDSREVEAPFPLETQQSDPLARPG